MPPPHPHRINKLDLHTFSENGYMLSSFRAGRSFLNMNLWLSFISVYDGAPPVMAVCLLFGPPRHDGCGCESCDFGGPPSNELNSLVFLLKTHVRYSKVAFPRVAQPVHSIPLWVFLNRASAVLVLHCWSPIVLTPSTRRSRLSLFLLSLLNLS